LILEFDRVPMPTPVAARLASGTSPPEIPFDAPPPRPHSWIELSVVDKNGQTLRGARLRLKDPQGGYRDLTTDGMSMLRLNVPEGECELELLSPGTPAPDA
jgi:hypothetical protein